MPDCRKSPSARSASVAARWSRIEPSTGGVLALVSKPGFDPNLFVDGIDPQNWEALNNSPDHPLNNRALQGVYPPGSTFKPFMALAALELGKRNPHHAIFDPGYFVLGGAGGHRYRDWKTGGHGMVDMHKSIVISCDTYYYGVAQELGIDNIHEFIGQFGFGRRTGIDIDGEAGGLLPSQEWKMRRFQQKWFAGDTISVGIGQGYNLATPLQLAQAVSVIANNGTMFRPHIVRHIQDSQTNELTSIDVEPVGTIALHAAEPGTGARRDGRRDSPGRHRRCRWRRCAVQVRRQDRYGAGGRHEAEREIRRAPGAGAAPRPCAVHRLRAGGRAHDRAGGPGGERRPRRLRRGADRARR